MQERSSSTGYQTQKAARDCHSHVHGLLFSHSHDYAHDDLCSHKSPLRSHLGLSSKCSPNRCHPHEIHVGHSERDEVYGAPGRSPDLRRGLSLLCSHLPLRLSPTPSWVVAWEGLQVPRLLLPLRPIMKPLWPIMKFIILATTRRRGLRTHFLGRAGTKPASCISAQRIHSDSSTTTQFQSRALPSWYPDLSQGHLTLYSEASGTFHLPSRSTCKWLL